MGEIFKESTEFKSSIDNATRLATYFRNANNKFFISALKELQKETYGMYIIPIVPCETKWNSLHAMCVSLLKMQRVLQVSIIIIKFTNNLL